ncbi:MAG: carboxylesterase family protein [Bacteroidaceae bacterium]|nr:carboxylesterase family protein [Bacteroidaceae bacterium]
MKKLLTVLACVLSFAAANAGNKSPILTIEGGQIQGVSTDIKGVTVYRGIPFAAPPTGQNRWRAPQPVIPWEGVKICDTFGHPPFQAAHYPGGYTTEWGYGEEAPYSEDCLYLNVWTKKPGKTDAKLPVAIWIFGGGMREGWGSEPEFDGQEWAAKDVVLVSFNYRVGPFGFFAHPLISAEDPEHATGNWGMLDQIEAMKWVQKNIAQFGGDPDNVMIFGQSAGSRSVKFLCSSPLTKGLFNKAVIMSGSGLVKPRPQSQFMGMQQSMTTLAQAEASAKEVMDWANLKTLAQMRNAGTETVFALPTIYQQVTGKRSILSAAPISPYIDGYTLPESFDDACLDNSLAQVPYLIGYTLNDAGNMGTQIVDFCLNREEMGGKAYAYQFARPLPDDGNHPEVTQRLRGAFHSSDLWFVFKSLKHCWRPWTKGDWDLSEKMLTAWSNFAKYGDPNGKDGGEWQPLTNENRQFMIFKLDENDAENSALGNPLAR